MKDKKIDPEADYVLADMSFKLRMCGMIRPWAELACFFNLRGKEGMG